MATSYLYRCGDCGDREFIIADSEELPVEQNQVPRVYPPYCPYCGKKDKVNFIREA